MVWIRHGRYYELKHIQTPTACQVFHIKLQRYILYYEKQEEYFL